MTCGRFDSRIRAPQHGSCAQQRRNLRLGPGGGLALAAVMLAGFSYAAHARNVLTPGAAQGRGQGDLKPGEEAAPWITVTNELPGVERAVSEQDLRDLIRDNLEPDLEPWLPAGNAAASAGAGTGRGRQGGLLTALDLAELLHEVDTRWPPYRRNFLALVAIRNNTFSFWTYPMARSWCTRRVRIAGEEFERHVRSHRLRFPDVVFVMNGYDKPLCPAGDCSAPIFSFGKCWQPAMPSVPCPAAASAFASPDAARPAARRKRPGADAPSLSRSLPPEPPAVAEMARQRRDARPPRRGGAAAAGKSPHEDILFPVMNHPFDSLLHCAPGRQLDVAFMRAGLYQAMAANCSRVLLYRLAQTDEGRALGLDVGIYQNRHHGVRVKTVAPVPIQQHPRYRFLFNTDGQAASWRLAKLLAMSSVVLKWRSPHVEYYYRSLRAGTHHVDVDERDTLRVLRELRAQPGGGDGAWLPSVPRNAQRFAYRYLSQLSRSAYASVALRRYAQLFAPGQMELLLDALPPARSSGDALGNEKEGGIAELLRLRRRLLLSG